MFQTSKEEPIEICRSKFYGDTFLAIRSCFGPLVQIESHGYVIHIGNRSSCAENMAISCVADLQERSLYVNHGYHPQHALNEPFASPEMNLNLNRTYPQQNMLVKANVPGKIVEYGFCPRLA